MSKQFIIKRTMWHKILEYFMQNHYRCMYIYIYDFVAAFHMDTHYRNNEHLRASQGKKERACLYCIVNDMPIPQLQMVTWGWILFHASIMACCPCRLDL